MARRRYGLALPLLLIGGGVLLLLGNLGVVDVPSWPTLLRFWPVLLIAIGIDLVFGRSTLRRAIATFVTIADRLLAAYLYSMSKMLGPYIPLIIVNCIIICRCEVCASKQPPLTAAADALGQSLGFAAALISIATVRELLGTGALFGYPVLPSFWPDWGIMALPPGAFLTFGILLAVVNRITITRDAKRKAKGSR